MRTASETTPIERASANDMMQRAAETGSTPMQVGAVLVLSPRPDLLVDARAALAARLTTVPRLRQRLRRAPFGGGRPVWVDDPTFTADRHVHVMACPAPGDRAALLSCATELVATRLPDDRPPWSATFVTGLERDRLALIVVFDHILADGIGGLAVLANLVDGMPLAPSGTAFPRPAPTPWAIRLDAARMRWHALTHWRRGLHLAREAMTELRPDERVAVPRTSLNRVTGPRRATATVQVDLDPVHAYAHAHGATINDVVLAAVAGALRDLLRARGEDVDHLVVSVPISARRGTNAVELGNAVGVLPLAVPTTGTLDERVEQIARSTRARKQAGASRGASAALVSPLFRLLGVLRVAGWFIAHQHLINTLVTNLHGPEQPLTFAGAAVEHVIPVSVVTGNVTVGFAVLSYAGTLTITINSDADACPDLPLLTERLRASLASIPTAVIRTPAIPTPASSRAS